LSRTDKDRPYWVKCNDPLLRRKATHDHIKCGKTVKRRRVLLDENGYPVLDNTPVYKYVPREGAIEKAGLDFWTVYLAGEKKYPEYFNLVEVPNHGDRYQYEYFTVREYPDRCTINEPLTGPHQQINRPCNFDAVEGTYPYGSYHYNKSGRKGLSDQERSYTRDNLRRLTVQANTVGGDEIDEDDVPNYLRYRPLRW
jgi:hypothetical protein